MCCTEWFSMTDLEGCGSIEPLVATIGTIKTDVTMGFLLPSGNDMEMMVGLQYCTDLFEESTGRQMARTLQAIIEAGVTSPHTPVTQLPMMTSMERTVQLEVRNHTS